MVTTVRDASDEMADRGYQTGKGVFGDRPRMRRIQDRTAHPHTYGFGSPDGDDLGVWNALSDQRVVRDHVVELQDHKFQPRTKLPVAPISLVQRELNFIVAPEAGEILSIQHGYHDLRSAHRGFEQQIPIAATGADRVRRHRMVRKQIRIGGRTHRIARVQPDRLGRKPVANACSADDR